MPLTPARYPSRGLSPAQADQGVGNNAPTMDALDAPRPRIPLEDDIMQLARLGEVGAIQKLFDSGKFDANFRDEQGITPLHWAAQKNHYALCHFLIQSGADVNAKGGDLAATPAAWAARQCNYYIVDLLLQNGADPLRTDNQGFNLLHSAVMDGNVFQLLLILHHDIPVDAPDEKGHTSLMWAAYKGFPVCVEVLLQWGANIDSVDEQGFTPLHWALVRGSLGCIQKLVEYGSDRFAKTLDGKTPSTIAKEMNSTKQWQRTLADCGYKPDGQIMEFPFSWITTDRLIFMTRFFFLWPFVVIFCALYLVSHLPVYSGTPLALVAVAFLQWTGQQLLKWAPQNMKHIHHTSYMAGVFASTLFWTGIQWVRRILPQTLRLNPWLNILFITFYTLTTYFYYLAMSGDPGYVPKSSSRIEQKLVVQDLINDGCFDEPNFCISCMVRKPLRSKHCKRCARCVAKQDHHCPWVNNCIGNNNHRHFFFYVFSLELGIALLIPLALSYLNSLPPSLHTDCSLLKAEFCDIYNKDPFTIVTMMWAVLQLTWVTMLGFVQLVQVSRAQTTYENMRGHSKLSGAGGMVTSAFVAGTTTLEGAQLTDHGRGPDPAGVPTKRPRQREGCFEQWKKLLGVDTFVATTMRGSRGSEANARQRTNPFSRGCYTNCTDFFCDPSPVFGRRTNGMALLGGKLVDYTQMYEPPPRKTMRMGRQDTRDVNYEQVDTEDHV